MYQHQEYPKMLYHATGKTIIVQDPDERAALGLDWCESPDEAAAAGATSVRPRQPTKATKSKR